MIITDLETVQVDPLFECSEEHVLCVSKEELQCISDALEEKVINGFILQNSMYANINKKIKEVLDKKVNFRAEIYYNGDVILSDIFENEEQIFNRVQEKIHSYARDMAKLGVYLTKEDFDVIVDEVAV